MAMLAVVSFVVFGCGTLGKADPSQDISNLANPKEELSLSKTKVESGEDKPTPTLEGIEIELDEASSEAVIVFQGIKVASQEVPKEFGEKARHKVSQANFLPKTEKTAVVDGVTWILISVNGSLYWVTQ